MPGQLPPYLCVTWNVSGKEVMRFLLISCNSYNYIIEGKELSILDVSCITSKISYFQFPKVNSYMNFP